MNRMFSLTVATLCGLAFLFIRRRGEFSTHSSSRRPDDPADEPQHSSRTVCPDKHDIFLAKWIETDNQLEITLSQFAGQRPPRKRRSRRCPRDGSLP